MGQIALTSKIKKKHGLGQYSAEPHYATLPFWQLCALKGKTLPAALTGKCVTPNRLSRCTQSCTLE